MRKTIQLTEGSAIRVEPIKIKDAKYVSIRKMYKKKTDTEWNYARGGVSLPVEIAEQVLSAAKRMASAADSKFKEVTYD